MIDSEATFSTLTTSPGRFGAAHYTNRYFTSLGPAITLIGRNTNLEPHSPSRWSRIYVLKEFRKLILGLARHFIKNASAIKAGKRLRFMSIQQHPVRSS